MTLIKTKPWNASDHINDPEEYLKASLEAVQETGDTRIFNQALQDVAKMQKFSVIAQKSGLGRESLYKALTPGSNPRFETINKVISAMGFKLTIEQA